MKRSSALGKLIGIQEQWNSDTDYTLKKLILSKINSITVKNHSELFVKISNQEALFIIENDKLVSYGKMKGSQLKREINEPKDFYEFLENFI